MWWQWYTGGKTLPCCGLAFDELDVVDNEEIVGLVLLAEGIVGVVAEGLNHAAYEILGMHIVNLGFGLEAQQLVAHGLRQMGFARPVLPYKKKGL